MTDFAAFIPLVCELALCELTHIPDSALCDFDVSRNPAHLAVRTPANPADHRDRTTCLPDDLQRRSHDVY
jgi:hypothetical protein